MKAGFAKLILFVAFAALVASLSGCTTNEPDNASVRPWNAPQGWENGLGGMSNGQHN